MPHAQDIMKTGIVADLLFPVMGLVQDGPTLHRKLTEYIAAGVNYVSLTVGLDHFPSIEHTAREIARFRAWILQQPDRYAIADSVEAIQAAAAAGRLAIGFNFQGTMPLMNDLNMAEAYATLGVRQMLLCYNQKNTVGDGCHERTDAGISAYGLALVRKLNEVGILVDLTHTGERTSLEAAQASAKPVIFSHSNPRALHDHERNISDAQIKACAATGGMIGVNGVGLFMSDDPTDVSPEQIVRHIRYMADLVGPEYIGFGLDYVVDQGLLMAVVKGDPERYSPEQYGNLDEIPIAGPEVIAPVLEALLRANYAEDQVRGIMGGNAMRVAREVWGR